MLICSNINHPGVQSLINKHYSPKPFGEIWGIGSGALLDRAKKQASEKHWKTILVPSVLSTDCMFTQSYADRSEEGHLIGYKPVCKMTTIVDLDILHEEVDWKFHRWGWFDILSSIIACNLTWSKKKNFNQSVANEMLALCKTVRKPNTRENLEILSKTLEREVQICDEFGSPDPEEGDEHRLLYALEPILLDRSLFHGELLAAIIEYYVDRYLVGNPWGDVYKKSLEVLEVDTSVIKSKIGTTWNWDGFLLLHEWGGTDVKKQ